MPLPVPPALRGLSRRLPALVAPLAAGLLLGACANTTTVGVLDRLTPYRVEVVQGNVVTREQLALLQVGMSRTQVRDVMGSPLLVDPFHAERWDYVFTIRRQGAATQERVIVLRFDGEALKSIDAPELPSEEDFVASIDTFKSRRDAGTLALTEEQRRALPVPQRATPPAEPASGPERDYPPLEPS